MDANSDASTIVYNSFVPPFTARYVKLIVDGAIMSNDAHCARFNLYGSNV